MRRLVSRLVATLAAGLLTAMAPTASAQESSYPERSITFLVPFAPGGVNDVLTRTLAAELRPVLGQAVVVENRPGANGLVAIDALLRQPADGYTLLMACSGCLAITPHLSQTLRFSPFNDLAPITLAGSSPLVILANPSVPAKTLQEFVSYAQANPSRLAYGSIGVGSATHLATELFSMRSNLKMTHVPYKGTSGAAMTELLAGQIQVMFDAPQTATPFIKSGKLKALAVTGDKRLRDLPDVPTAMESGMPGFQAGVWFAVVARAGTPPEVVRKLNDAIRKILASPQLAEKFEPLGLQLQTTSPEELDKFIREEHRKWGEVIRANNITVQ